MPSDAVVIVGAGHAGVQAAVSLREEGFDGDIVLLSAEKELPYQRPPLSKAFLKGEMDIHGLPLRAEAHFSDQRIELKLGVGATRIDRAARRVEFSNGETIGYGHLILATGARQRRLEVPGVDLPGSSPSATLPMRPRSASGSARGARLSSSGRGSSASKSRRPRPASRPRRRSSRSRARWACCFADHVDFFLKAHAAFGARFRLGVGVTAIKGREHAETVVLTDGEGLSADMVVVGVGVVAEDLLARACGLECANGIVVDEYLRTSDPAISAIGDCADFPNAALGFRTRLESVQNAVDQGARSPGASPASPSPMTISPGSGATSRT